jgi:hypothetical protein
MPIKRDDLKNADWLCVLEDLESYSNTKDARVLPTNWLNEDAKRAIDNGGALIAGPEFPLFELKELINWAIDNGYFDDAIKENVFEKLIG